MDSILLTIKKLLGIENDYDGFDNDIILAINTAFMSLNQLGVGVEEGYSISGIADVWSDFLLTSTNLEGVKSYIYLKTRLLFDPPTNSFLIEAINRQIEELGWRLLIQADPLIE